MKYDITLETVISFENEPGFRLSFHDTDGHTVYGITMSKKKLDPKGFIVALYTLAEHMDKKYKEKDGQVQE